VRPRLEISPDGGGGGGCGGGGGGGLGTPTAFLKAHFHMVWIVMAYSRFHSPSNTSQSWSDHSPLGRLLDARLRVSISGRRSIHSPIAQIIPFAGPRRLEL
jgi:hypothetical protein